MTTKVWDDQLGMPRTLLWLACTLWLAASLPAAGGDGTKDVLARARRYVADYDRALIAVVADEHYVQTARTLEGRRIIERERVLDSEFGWIHVPAPGETIGVRDVLRVDGRTVTDGFRLRALLERPPQDASREIRAILAESARHNIGAPARNFNFPTFALVYLRRGGDDAGTRWRADGGDVTTVLRFEERQHSTVVRTSEGAPTRGSGRFTIETASGRVIACDIRLALPRPRVRPVKEYRVWVEFARDERLGLLVPARMIEHFGYAGDASGVSIGMDGEATYRNYRRYETTGRLLPR